MIGDGELLESCMALSRELCLEEKIDFCGIQKQEIIAQQFQRSLVYVQHSMITPDGDSEGTPLSILEAGACGLPVISTHHGGITDVIIDGETGFLVNEGDIKGMAEKMILLANNPAQAHTMGRYASEVIREKHDINDSIKMLWDIITENN
jgi:colanic acid/amylovoran biosynthesis glycosyltransferase